MLPRTVEESRDTAERANRYVRSFRLYGTTHGSLADLDEQNQKEVAYGLTAIRETSQPAMEYGLGPNSKVNYYNHALNARNTGYANCGENACLALDYITTNEPNAYAEIYGMSIDHAICVVDRDKDSIPEKPETWGPNAYVCDPWSNEVYPAAELLKEHTYSTAVITQTPTTDDPYHLSIERGTEVFDPKKDQVYPQEHLNTDVIRKANAEQDLEQLAALYEEKLAVIQGAMSTYRDDLQSMSTRLNQDNHPLSKEKAQIVGSRRDYAQTFLSYGEGAAPLSYIAPDADYVTKRAALESDLASLLQSARSFSQLSPADNAALQKSKNPFLDKLFNRVPQTAKDMENATQKFRARLNTLQDIKPSPLQRTDVAMSRISDTHPAAADTNPAIQPMDDKNQDDAEDTTPTGPRPA